MSLVNTAVTSAIAIAERRSKRFGSNIYAGRSHVIMERGFTALRRTNWFSFASGFLEPVFFLLSFGFGVGQLVGGITDGSGNSIPYAAYIAPALLATSAMNGAIYDSTWNVYFKMHFAHLYETILSTSIGVLDVALGEISWALWRGALYASAFLAIMWPAGLITTPWAILAIFGAVFIAFGFASFGMAITSYLKSFQQMQWINFFLMPMFLFSGTFFPLTTYPDWLQLVVKALPLWHGIELERALMLGIFSVDLLGHIAYFVVMIIIGLVFTTKRLNKVFLS